MVNVIGVGNALVDLLIRIPDNKIIEELSLQKGSMQLVDKEFIGTVLNKTSSLPKAEASGGSAANTIHGLAALGVKTGFIGTIGKDTFGEVFTNDLKKSNIEPYLFVSDVETGIAGTLITPDSERTFTTFLGAAGEISQQQIVPQIISEYQIFHIEGYLVFNQGLIAHIAKVAKDCGLIISLDLASFNVVEANLDYLRKLVKEYVDIVFANEEEAKAFTGKEPEEALNEIATMAKIAVVKVGKNGSLIKSEDITYDVSAIAAKPIDTTGAGDLYAGGFLYGYAKGLPFEKCGKIGSLLAGKVIEQLGAQIPPTVWDEIRKKVAVIESE